MTIATQSPALPFARATAPAPEAAEVQVEAAPQDFEEDKVTWGQAFTGLGAAVAVAGIETVGNTVSSIVKAPEATYHAYKALFSTPRLGPVLKRSIAFLLPAAVVAAPVLTALGSAGFGLFRGFSEGIENGFGSAIKEGVNDVKTFHKELAGGLVQELREYQEYELPPGEEPFDISVLGGIEGLAAGVVSGAIEGVGIGASTLLHTPKGVWRVGEELWSSEASLPLKAIGTALIPVGAVLATPIGLVGGAIYGLATGAATGYQEGIVSSVGEAFETVADYHKGVGEALRD